jgi:antitoxin component of RelBE/YafQ-DinJ toxin-antitoxin module
MIKEIKDTFIKIRITPSQKQEIQDYCDKYGLTVSEFIRTACMSKIEGVKSK